MFFFVSYACCQSRVQGPRLVTGILVVLSGASAPPSLLAASQLVARFARAARRTSYFLSRSLRLPGAPARLAGASCASELGRAGRHQNGN